MIDPSEKSEWIRQAEQHVLESSRLLEKTELVKEKIKSSMEMIFDANDITPLEKIVELRQTWKMLMDYDESILPISKSNLEESKRNLSDLKKIP